MKKQLEHEIKASPPSKLYMKNIEVAIKFANTLTKCIVINFSNVLVIICMKIPSTGAKSCRHTTLHKEFHLERGSAQVIATVHILK